MDELEIVRKLKEEVMNYLSSHQDCNMYCIEEIFDKAIEDISKDNDKK